MSKSNFTTGYGINNKQEQEGGDNNKCINKNNGKNKDEVKILSKSVNNVNNSNPEEKIKTEEIQFRYGIFDTQDFINILQHRNEREKFFFIKLLFKMNQHDIIFNMPEIITKKSI